MESFGKITDADLDVAVHADPSTDPVVWQQGAETIEECFKPGGTFWREPINSNGEYMSEGSASMSISEASGGLGGSSSRNRIGIGTPNAEYGSEGSRSISISEAGGGIGGSSSGNRVAIVTSTDNNSSSNIGTSSVICGAMNGLSTVHYSSDNPPPSYVVMRNNYIQRHFPPPPVRVQQQQYPGSGQNTTYDSSPPATQPTKQGPRKRPSPTVEIKQSKQRETMNADLSNPVTPQLGTPYVRGCTTRSTKGAEDMRREMEEQKLADTPVKSAPKNPKRKKRAESETPVRPRKQPKRAAKNKK
ncbi:hypothetical protein Q7P35_012079 [Cladosporium inversicolor]